MLRKLPIIRSSAKIGDILYAISKSAEPRISFEFKSAMSAMTEGRGVFLTDSGISAFYVILKALSGMSGRKEVVLSAYTAGSLIAAIRKAGLKPVLCDISTDGLNASYDGMVKAVSKDTLAVLAVHMFGIAMHGVDRLRNDIPSEVYIIEDCCQAMGAASQGRRVGESGDIAFFSFNRGKNMPLCGGGFIDTHDFRIREALDEEMKAAVPASLKERILSPAKALAFCLVTNPYIYGPLYFLASRFKESTPDVDIRVSPMGHFQAALGMRLVDRLVAMTRKRCENGNYLIGRLSSLSGLALPDIPDGDSPAFNRLPVIFRDLEIRRLAEDRLKRAGVESSRMYLRPLHHMFDLGYEMSAFPNAAYAAEHLLTLPVYPALKRRDLDRIADAVSGAFK